MCKRLIATVNFFPKKNCNMKKSTYKILAIIFTIFVLGALSETNRISNSTDADIADNRTGLLIMAISVTVITIVVTIFFWKKSK